MLKSSGKSNQLLKGYLNEYRAAVYYHNLGFQILFHRFETPFAEVDLICHKPGEKYVLVEVKSLSSPMWGCYRVSRRQRDRLQRALLWFQAQVPQMVELHLAFVDNNGHIDVIEDFFG